MPNSFELSVDQLKGVGPKLANRLAELHIYTLQDLLFHLPLRYEDRSTVTDIAQIAPNQHVLLQGEVTGATILFGKRRSLLVNIKDDTGSTKLRFYHFNGGQKNALNNSRYIRCFGEVRLGSTGLELYHPEYTLADEPFGEPSLERLSAIYPTVKNLNQKTWRSLIQQALVKVVDQPPRDYLSVLDNQKNTLLSSLQTIHQPPKSVNVAQLVSGQHPCQQRLILEELAAQYIGQQQARQQFQTQQTLKLSAKRDLQQTLQQQLPYALTGAQQRVVAEIAHDLELNVPMLRLVQGDVGSGKTLVAAMAALQAIGNGYQVAVMAPTELLAEQHLANFTQWLQPLGFNVALLVGSSSVKQRRERLAQLASGEIQLLVGTHAIFQEGVDYAQLALVIIDEQHRFGVHQRLSLKQKNTNATPHQLVMTATPIPRTLAMSHYAQLDISIIDELPPGRKPITTTLLETHQKPRLIERVDAAIESSHQAYWVCTLIEENDELQAQAAEAAAEELIAALPHRRIGLIHGRLKAAEKAEVMAAFKNAEIDLLVATTVIEVGVDVPNANLMVIENPERLGLAQLHQLRGRVGRGSAQSYCVLLYQKPLSQNGKKRLQAMRSSTDGFVIAEQDLAIRGPGEILGTRQTGELRFRIADLTRDAALLPKAQAIGQRLLQTLSEDEQTALLNRWLAGKLHYGDV